MNTDIRMIRWLTFMMFLMFAMTSDAVGSVIPVVIEQFRLSLTAASAFHYAPMTAIALGAILFGYLADRLGRKRTIMLGLLVYGGSCLLFAVGSSFGQLVGLLAMSGVGISIFKTGALALSPLLRRPRPPCGTPPVAVRPPRRRAAGDRSRRLSMVYSRGAGPTQVPARQRTVDRGDSAKTGDQMIAGLQLCVQKVKFPWN